MDDVLEYDTKSAFPATGEEGKIYVDKSNNTSWRWSGSQYTQIKGDLTIGTATGTAADGKIVNDHINNTSNPHGVTKAQVGLGSVVNTGDSATPVLGGTTKFTTGGAYTELAKKVDKVSGKGLSTNDYTTEEKNKLSGIESGAQTHRAPTTAEVKSALGTGSGTSKYLREDGTWQTPPEGFKRVGNGLVNSLSTNYDTTVGVCAVIEGAGDSSDSKISASGNYSHAEGLNTTATNPCSHAEGISTTASGNSSHAEGGDTTASGYYSHAEGDATEASGESSHAEGYNTVSSGDFSHAEGNSTTASNDASHAEGNNTSAGGDYSHAEGYHTQTTNPAEHASGQYNVSNNASETFGNSGNTLFSVGNGTADNARHNAFEIRQNGDIYIVSGGTSTSPMIKLQDNFDTINTSIEDLSGQSETIAAALVELNKAVDNLIPVTYADLVELKTSNELKPGTLYRITDFVTTTTQANTQSAGHAFDVIVRADANNKLNENAYAALHSGDTYFANSKLEAWQLKYCLDNDTDRFMWADDTNGKGVIYYMKDEFNNECPYDFKNIQFKRWAATVSESYPSLSGLNGTYCLSRLYNGNDGFNGDVFSIKDEDDFVWRYTFHCYLINENKHVDATLVTSNNGDSICIGNVIKDAHGHYDEDYYYKKIYLNDIVFYNEYKGDGDNVCIGNYIHYGCFNNTFLNGCYYNKLGGYCYFNTFGNSCGGNSFGNHFQNNSFGNSCYNNSFGNECRYNSFGNSCRRNSFGNECQYNSFGNNNYSNSFGNSCYNNSFGNECYYNSFGNECYYNSFGNGCNNNSFGNECQYIHFLKDYTWYIIVENGNKYIDITSTQSTSESSKLRNFTIAQGVNTDGTSSTKKTISHNTVNDTFQTVYQPANSQVISV